MNILRDRKSGLNLIHSGFLSRIVKEEYRPLLPNDCKGHDRVAEQVLKTILESFQEVDLEEFKLTSNVTKEIFVPIILLCGEHSEMRYWTSSATIAFAYQILAEMKRIFRSNSVREILLNSNSLVGSSTGNVLKWCITELSPKLTSEG